MSIAIEVGDGRRRNGVYGNLDKAYRLGQFQGAIEYQNKHLSISKEVGDRVSEGRAYGNLGNAYHSLGQFKDAIEYHEKDLSIAKEVGDRADEGMAYGNLGKAYRRLGQFQKSYRVPQERSVDCQRCERQSRRRKSIWQISVMFITASDSSKKP